MLSRLSLTRARCCPLGSTSKTLECPSIRNTMEILPGARPYSLHSGSECRPFTPTHSRTPRSPVVQKYFPSYPSASTLSAIHSADTLHHQPPLWLSYFAHIVDFYSQSHDCQERAYSVTATAKTGPAATLRPPPSQHSRSISKSSAADFSVSETAET